jgi:uncharacterized protein YdhG (YjbR/CyaY superfamily)
MKSYESVEQYLESIENIDAKASLTWIRSIIRSELPDAEETISYGMPMFKLHGMVVGFAAFKKHCSLFPGHTVADFADELKDYKTSKGTIQFPNNKPLPEALVRAIVRARANENVATAELKNK